jgi:hypothetical protein
MYNKLFDFALPTVTVRVCFSKPMEMKEGYGPDSFLAKPQKTGNNRPKSAPWDNFGLSILNLLEHLDKRL